MGRNRQRLFVVVCLAASPLVHAFNFESVASEGCHERLSTDALQVAGWPVDATVPASTREDEILADALPFRSPAGTDLWTLSLLIGARDNDFHGAGLLELTELHAVHMAADLQAEHCLRAPEQNHALGDLEAIESCRAFILAELERAIPDPGESFAATEAVPLALREQTLILALPAYPFHVGRALHALQDGFSHTLRSSDFGAVHGVFNYVDPNLDPAYAEARDGHRHVSAYDECSGPEAEPRAQAAQVASQALLAALADPTGGKSGRIARAAGVIDSAFQLRPLCEGDSAWCAQSQSLLDESLSAQGCSQAPGPLLPVAALLAAAALRRVASKRGRTALLARRSGHLAGLVLTLTLVSTPARAEAPRPMRLTFLAAVSGDRAGAAVGAGARWQLADRLELSAMAELNPWMDLSSFKPAPGVANLYVDGAWTWAQWSGIGVRSTAGAGVSILLFDTLGARTGSVGPFLKASVIGVRFPVGTFGFIDLHPEIVLPIPSMRGVPLLYRQYRLSVALTH